MIRLHYFSILCLNLLFITGIQAQDNSDDLWENDSLGNITTPSGFTKDVRIGLADLSPYQGRLTIGHDQTIGLGLNVTGPVDFNRSTILLYESNDPERVLGLDGNQIAANDDLYISTNKVGGRIGFFGNEEAMFQIWEYGTVDVHGNFQIRRKSNDQKVNSIGTDVNGNMVFYRGLAANNFPTLFVNDETGNVTIGGVISESSDRLTVDGSIRCSKVVVSLDSLPDYVFEEDYDLMSLEEVENYITENKHLPGVPSAQAVYKGGMDVGEMQAVLLKKVEETTLYLLQQQETIKAQQKQIAEQAALINTLIEKIEQ